MMVGLIRNGYGYFMNLYYWKSFWFLFFTIIFSGGITGCQMFQNDSEPLLAIPRQVSYDNEAKIAKLSQQLYIKDLDNETKIQLLYQRAILYDAIGLRAFALSDFTHILNIDSTIPDIYNYLGIYSATNGDYDASFMAFNTAEEIDPEFQYTYINRALALYQYQRYEPALHDILTFYKFDTNDPMRLLWVYLIAEKLDQDKAKSLLVDGYNRLTDKTVWGSDIVAFYLGKISEKQLMSNLQQGVEKNYVLAQRLCETYFYLGKYFQSKGNNKRAEVMFKYALANNVYNYLEHKQALFELTQLTDKK